MIALCARLDMGDFDRGPAFGPDRRQDNDRLPVSVAADHSNSANTNFELDQLTGDNVSDLPPQVGPGARATAC